MSTEIRYVERAAYRPPAYRVEHADLTFELDAERTVIRSRLELVRTSDAADNEPLRLDGRDFELLSLALDGVPLGEGYTWTDDCLVVQRQPERCVLEAVTAVRPAENRSEMGLFLAGSCLVTQCEADGFSRMTFYVDRPDVMATFRVRLEADVRSFPVLLSNGDSADSGELPGGRHFVTWHDPHPKPCYVFAVIAGCLESKRDTFTTRNGKDVELVIYAEPHHIDDCEFAMGSLKRALAWDEAEYGLEYDLTRYSIVAIDDYSGAMENKGLNLFEAKGIVANPAYSTDNDYLVLERILAHEVLHNWTGNRVTCRDWFELCLKEGLTRFRDRQFAEAMSAPGPKRIDAVALLRRNQFVEDDGNAAHPVKPERYADVQNLYTATVYEKGAELVRMLWVLVGPNAFRRGLGAFLQRYDGQAVTTNELLKAMAEASGRDLGRFQNWYVRAGRPVLQSALRYDPQAGSLELTLTQTTRDGHPDSEPLLVPISYALFVPGADGVAELFEEGTLEFGETSRTWRFEGLPARPTISLLRGLSAPVSLELDREDEELALLLRAETDAVARWDASQQLATRAIRRLAGGAPWQASGGEKYAECIGALLDDVNTDSSLLARLLTPPDEPTLSEGLERVELDAHAAARRELRSAVASSWYDCFEQRYKALSSAVPYAPEPAEIGRRALRNACLGWLLASDVAAARHRALAQIRTSDNMTDSYAALSELCHEPGPARDEAVAICLERWRGQPLAMVHWLTAQALGTAPDTVDRVIALAGHPDVDLQDIAQAMALFGSFFRQNRHAFHDPSGRGYEFLADTLLQMDKVRPSGSFWLMPQISQWPRFDEHRQQKMRQALLRVRAAPGISRGLAENVQRALGDDTP